MSREWPIIVYWGGQIKQTTFGTSYAGGQKKSFRIFAGVGFNELLQKVSSSMKLGPNQFVSKIIYRMPLSTIGFVNYGDLEIEDDDTVITMFETVHALSGVSCIELYVQVVSIAPNVNVEEGGYVGNWNAERDNGGWPEMEGRRSWDINEAGPSNYHSSSLGVVGTAEFERQSQERGQQETEPSGGDWVDIPVTNDYLVMPDNSEDDIDHDSGDDEAESDSCRGEVSGPTAYAGMPAVMVGTFTENMPSTVPIESFLAHRSSISHFWHVNTNNLCVNPDGGSSTGQWTATQEFFVGQVFPSKDNVQHAIKEYSIQRNLDFFVVESTPSILAVKCKRYHEGCPWRLRAVKKNSVSFWRITRYNGAHVCYSPNLSLGHAQLDSRIIATLVQPLIKEDVTVKVSVIQATVKTHYNVEVSYRKAWEAKQKAIAMVYGDWNESYKRLPSFMAAVQATNPGTAVEWQKDDCIVRHGNRERYDQRYEVFKRVFWAFRPSIEGFRNCRPLIQTDGTFLYGKYKGSLLIATALDGNNHVFPIAYAIVEGENKDSWAWFMVCLRRHVIRGRRGVVVISDRHIGIISAMESPHLGWSDSEHCFCLRHVVSNYNTIFHQKFLKDLLFDAGKQFQRRKFNKIMNEIQALHPESWEWINSIPLKQWTLSHSIGCRYGLCTTNHVECINGVLKGARCLPITALVEATFARSVQCFDKHTQFFSRLLQDGKRFTPMCMEILKDRESRANVHHVNSAYDRTIGVFEVHTGFNHRKQKGGNVQVVKLEEGSCTCGKFQGTKIPCSHVIAACRKVAIDYTNYVESYYSLDVSKACYSYLFRPIGHPDYWPLVEGPTLIPNQSMRREKGRPQSSRLRNEMDWREEGPKQKCGICSQEGHNRRTCPNREYSHVG